MNQHINLIAFGTFGSPNGFTQSFFAGNNDLKGSIKTFDLRTDAIKLYPNSEIYSIRKELANGKNAISYSKYTFAKEQNSERGGTFIGSSILFKNKIADENITISMLNSFHQNLIDQNVKDHVIRVNHSDNFSSLTEPQDFDKLYFTLREVDYLNFAQSSNKTLVVYCLTNSETLQKLFKESLALLNVFDSIYFTKDSEVAEFVLQKGVFQLEREEGFKKEIQKLHEERKRKSLELIAKFSTEKQRLEDDRQKMYENLKSQLEKNRALHKQNDQTIKESENDLNKISSLHTSFSRKIDEFSNQLKSESKELQEILKLYNETNTIFKKNISSIKSANFIKNLSQPRQMTGNLETFHSKHDRVNQYPVKEQKEEKIDVFKIATLLLFFLWVSTFVYFIHFNDPQKTTVLIDSLQEQTKNIEQPSVSKNNKELKPIPNSELNERECGIVAKKISFDMPIEEIVKIIFETNPTDIRGPYAYQANEYVKEIFELNRICFKEKNGQLFYVQDTLRHIPSYKTM